MWPCFDVSLNSHIRQVWLFLLSIFYLSILYLIPKVYPIQHYVIKFFNDMRQVGGFFQVPPVSSTNKTGRYHINWNIVESGIKHHNPTLPKIYLKVFINYKNSNIIHKPTIWFTTKANIHICDYQYLDQISDYLKTNLYQ